MMLKALGELFILKSTKPLPIIFITLNVTFKTPPSSSFLCLHCQDVELSRLQTSLVTSQSCALLPWLFALLI